MSGLAINGSSIPVTFTFGPSISVNATDKLDGNAQWLVAMDFGRISGAVGVQSNRVDFETGATPQLPSFVFGAANQTKHAPWETTGLGLSLDSNDQSHVFIYANDAQNVDQAWRLAAIAQGLGLKGRGQPSPYGAWNQSIGMFPNDTLSSVTFTEIAPCANVSRLGALDMRALVDLYGYATGMDKNAVITVDDDFGTGGIVASADANNTLRAASNSNFAVQVYMRDDGIYDTFVGDSVARLAPGSAISHADIGGTNGGLIIGNDLFMNFMNGSRYNDSFVVGQMGANITLNGGHDMIVLPSGTAQTYVQDMNKNSTIWIVPTNDSSAPKVAAWKSGSSVVSEGGPSVYLSTMLPQDVAPLVHYAVPAVTNQSSSPTYVALCASDLLELNVSAPSHAATPFDPCAHIGDPNMGGATTACIGNPWG